MVAFCSCGRLNYEFVGQTASIADPAGPEQPPAIGAGGADPVDPKDDPPLDPIPSDASAPGEASLVTTDAGTKDSGATDAAMVAPPDKPFGAPSLITGLSTPGRSENDPSLTEDRLEIVFSSSRSGNIDLWVSRRDSVDAAWDPPSPLDTLNTPDVDANPELSADGLTLYFGSGESGAREILVTTRATRLLPFAAPSPVVEVNTTSNELHLGVSKDGLEGILSRRINETGIDLFRTTRDSTLAPWGPLVALDAANSPRDDLSGRIVGGGLSLYFSRTKDGVGEIYRSRRPSSAEPFGAPVLLEELNSEANDINAWVSEDERHIVFSSQRNGGFDLYEATR